SSRRRRACSSSIMFPPPSAAHTHPPSHFHVLHRDPDAPWPSAGEPLARAEGPVLALATHRRAWLSAFLLAGDALVFPVALDESIDVPHLHVPPAVLPGNAIAYAVIAHKSVPADFSHLKPVFGQTVRWRKRSKRLPRQPINRTFPGRPVNAPVLLVAPLPRLTVQVLHIRNPSARHEILLNESGGPFHLAFGLRTLDPANFGNHADRGGKILKQRMPSGSAVIAHAQNDRFHPVCQHGLRNPAKVLQRVDQAAQ